MKKKLDNNTEITCGLFNNIAPLYSLPLWRNLSQSKIVDYHFFSSFKSVSGIKTIPLNNSIFKHKDGEFKWKPLRNIYLKQILIFQIGLIYKCIKTNYDVYIFGGEMNNISTWIGAIICRLKKKKVLFWGHGLYGNENFMKKKIRIAYFKLASGHLLYGKRAKKIMLQHGFLPKNLHVVNNSLNYKKHKIYHSNYSLATSNVLRKKLFPKSQNLPIIVFIGRLTNEKKLYQLIEAMKFSYSKGYKFNCLIIGDGKEKENLADLTYKYNLQENVVFYGACYNEKENANMILTSDCCVSPGDTGLTAIHSLSLGVPVITHNNLSTHGPEVEAIILNKTGLFFEENNIESLAKNIIEVISNHKKTKWGKNCISEVEKDWTPEKHAKNFDEAIIKTLSK